MVFTSFLWLTLIGLLLTKTIGVHYENIVKYSKQIFDFFPPNYSWFMQYIENDNTKINIIEFPLGMNLLPYT
jgi:hypothetical protein